MNTLFIYIFKHRYFSNVIDTYKSITEGPYLEAYGIWCKKFDYCSDGKFRSKEHIVSKFSEIRQVHEWIEIYNSLYSNCKEGFLWYLNEQKHTEVLSKDYDEYELISRGKFQIRIYQSLMDKYHQMMQTSSESINRFLNTVNTNHDYQQISKIVSHEREINKIDLILSKANKCRALYALAWKEFSQCRSVSELSLELLETINIDDFKIKNDFLILYNTESKLINLIAGNNFISLSSFSKEAIDQEKWLLGLLMSRELPTIGCLSATIHIEDDKKLKRAILDSLKYGIKCNFDSSFTISKFYKFRKDFEEHNVLFDDAVNKRIKYSKAIKAYNKENYNEENVIYIDDYLNIMIEGSDLYNYIEKFKEEDKQRKKAITLKEECPKGFEAVFGSIDISTCPFTEVITVLSDENNIKDKENQIREYERRRRESEQKRLEEERIRKEAERVRRVISDLKGCVSSWPRPYKSTLPCFSLYYYYPITCPWEAVEAEWCVRKLIWDFKANPNRPMPEGEIMSKHRTAMNDIIPSIKRVLDHYFGSKLNKLTLVCIPSSKQTVTVRRYKDFSEILCDCTGMDNAFGKVRVVSDGEAAHLGGTLAADYYIDNNYFKGKYVLLFDDVITSGRSMERLKNMLEGNGAVVIGGISIGKTKHERQPDNPIDSI